MSKFEEEIGNKIPDLYVRTMLNIRHTAHFFGALSEKLMKPYGISGPQYNILRILRGAGEPITMNVVKDRMIEKSPNATRLMDKLCEKKLIERVRCEHDRRAVYVSIRKEGLQLLEDLNLDEMQNQIRKLTEEEAITLGNLLDKIRAIDR